MPLSLLRSVFLQSLLKEVQRNLTGSRVTDGNHGWALLILYLIGNLKIVAN